MYGLLLNPILGDRRILRRGLHEEAVIQSNELPVVTFLEPDQVKLKKKNCLSNCTMQAIICLLQKPTPVLCLLLF